jgi:hypothetical protein
MLLIKPAGPPDGTAGFSGKSASFELVTLEQRDSFWHIVWCDLSLG